MASQAHNTKQRHHCDHDGCNKSYLRVEHLNRHRLTHQERAFSCFLCEKPFTRNDLLQAHIRRHEAASSDNVDKQREINPPHNDHHQGSRKRTKAGWDSGARPFAPPGEIDFGSAPLQQPAGADISPPLDAMAEPQGFPLERVIFGAAVGVPFPIQDEMHVDPELQIDEQQGDDFDLKLMISNDLYQSLLAEFPQLATLTSGDKISLQRFFLSGFEYLEMSMPLFHRPTCDVSAQRKSVILAVCSLGGILSANSDDRELGLVTYKHLHGSFYTAAKDKGSAWLMANVLAVLIIEHIGYYGLKYEEHVLTDVTHAMTTTIFRQRNFSSQWSHSVESITGSLDERWKHWIEIEFNISVFLADIKSSMHFMRPAMLSTSMLDLPLPYPSSIWQAETAVEWEKELARSNEASKNSAPLKFGQLVVVLLGHDHPSPEYNNYFRDPVTMDVVIHAIVSEMLDLSRAVPTASSKAIDLLKKSDLGNGLARWRSYFDQMDAQIQESEIAASALATYHLAGIFLREEISALIASCGASSLESLTSFFSSSDNDDRSGKRDAFKIGKDACIHAVKIVKLYLRESFSTRIRSFYQNHTAVIACLVLTTYMSNIKQPREPERREMASRHENSDINTSQLLKLLGDQESQTSGAESQYFEAAIAIATQLLKAVRDRVAVAPGETSQNSCRMLDRLLGNLS
ncbi:hypothetical protein DL98DRAFT_622146 [Cadophora sp. DSE1049]|nr:hypothetical protein DL98DRAFT_622146 [Cadophora sp. DSE1049]